jgi:hypothetical protein
MSKNYIKYIDKDSGQEIMSGGLFGFSKNKNNNNLNPNPNPNPNTNINPQKPAFSGVTPYTIQMTFNELNTNGIQPAIKEINCCLGNIEKIRSLNAKQQQYLGMLIYEFKNYNTKILEIVKSYNYIVVFDFDRINNTRKDFDEKIKPTIKVLFDNYKIFLQKFLGGINNNNLPIYKISQQYKRDPKNINCDLGISPSNCTELFAAQKLTKIVLLMDRLEKDSKELMSDQYINNNTAVQNLQNQKNNIKLFIDDVSNFSLYIKGELIEINDLQGQLNDWNKNHSVQFGKNSVYGNEEIPVYNNSFISKYIK